MNLRLMVRPFLMFVLLLFSLFPASSQEPTTLEEITASAVSRRLILEEGSLFQDNYQRFFLRRLEEVGTPLFGFSGSMEMQMVPAESGTGSGFEPGVSGRLGILVQNAGWKNLRFTGRFSGNYRDLAAFLQPLDTADWVDPACYRDSLADYQAEAEVTLGEVVTLGWGLHRFTEAWKAPDERLPYGELLEETEFQKWTLNVGHLDRLFRLAGKTLNPGSRLRYFADNFALKNSLLTDALMVPKLLNNTVYTGLKLMPLTGIFWLPEEELFLTEFSFFIPLGPVALYWDLGLAPLELTVYRFNLRMDILCLMAELFGSDRGIREIRNSFFDAGRQDYGSFFHVGPKLSYFDGTVLKESFYPYDRSMVLPEYGLNLGLAGGLYMESRKHLYHFQMDTVFYRIRDYPRPWDEVESTDYFQLKFQLELYFK